jgi:RNA polymerase sigma factor (sigma-70 family)
VEEMTASLGDLEMLYRARYERFLRLATAVAGDEVVAADAVQDAFARAIAHRKAFRSEGSLEGWVWRIVINAARAARQRHPAVELTETSEPYEADEDRDPYGIDRWLAALPERERLAVFLRYFADLDYRGIAVALDIKVGTVGATLHDAHEALRRSLKEASQP